jgi:hypothetical protein
VVGVHHWLKSRSTREERKPVTRNDDDNSNNNNNNNNNNIFPTKTAILGTSHIIRKVLQAGT